MDKEKMLKKFIIKFCVGEFLSATVLFIWAFAFTEGFIDEKTWVISGLIMIAVALLLAYISNKLYGKKEKRLMLQIMPLIISVNDTIESLEKEKCIFFALDLLSFSFGSVLGKTHSIFLVLMASSVIFRRMESITAEKIKYLENKPEGL